MFKEIPSLKEVLEESKGYPVLIYKHSATCGKSASAQREVESYMGHFGEDVYRLVVQTERPLSDEIAETLNVKHETPQLIGVSNSRLLFVLNHDGINKADIERIISRENI
ncbi:bacillithiol system redox-active protein YtxJ [Candidatus Pacearchaeota archaeon]|nr:bacillithiol system redox-active protein YtxJ [Candidatus Pacearchaeota archaeon]